MASATAGDLARARECHDLALEICGPKRIPREQARAREGIGHCLLGSGQRAGAIWSFRAARDLYETLQSPSAPRLAALIATLGQPSGGWPG